MTSTKPVALITGASSGIGSVYAKRHAARGMDLILVARRGDRLRQLAEKLGEQHGTTVRVLEADLTDLAGLAVVEEALLSTENLELLVNNAGMGKLAATAELSPEDVGTMIALNVTALTRLTHAVLPRFLASGKGSIVNIASVVAFGALPINTVYSATKSFVLMFTQGLQQEVAGTSVYLQAVLPSLTGTEFFEEAGFPISALDPAIIMTTEDMVDAALVGFERREDVSIVSLHDISLWEAYEAARTTLYGSTMVGQPASRYVQTDVAVKAVA